MSLVFVFQGWLNVKIHHGHMHMLMEFCHCADAAKDIISGSCIAFSSFIPVLKCIWNAVTVAGNEVFFLIWNIIVCVLPLLFYVQEQFLLFLEFFSVPLNSFMMTGPFSVRHRSAPRMRDVDSAVRPYCSSVLSP